MTTTTTAATTADGLLPPTAPVASPARVGWVDDAKGLGIILVVLGHTYRGLIAGGGGPWPLGAAVDAWIYLFHMPLFFFLGGLFLQRSARKSWGHFLGDKLRTIAYPYFVWSIFTILIKAGLGRVVNRPRGLGDLNLIWLHPVEQFWFLYALFFLVIALAVLIRWGVPPLVVVLLAAAVHPGFGLPTGDWVPLLQMRANAIYVALGLYFQARVGAPRVGDTPGPWLGALALMGLLAPTLVEVTGSAGRFPLEVVAALGGIAAVVALATLADRSGRDRVLQVLGRNSLEIFVAHTLVSAMVRILLTKFAGVTDLPVHLVVGTVAGLVGPTLVGEFARRADLRGLFTWPHRSGTGRAFAAPTGPVPASS